MGEKFCLKWNDYQTNWKRSLSEFYTDSDLADVTLVSEDKVKFSAHKIILSSCSNLFKFILKGSTNTHPLLFLGGVSSVNLRFIMDYIYQGEVSLFQEQLDSFLESANKLEIEGLLGNNEGNDEMSETSDDIGNQTSDYEQTESKQMIENGQKLKSNKQRQCSRLSSNFKQFDVSSLTPEEIKQKTMDLFEKRNGFLSCLACEYTVSNSGKIKRHVEIHFDGLSYPCTFCRKEFR